MQALLAKLLVAPLLALLTLLSMLSALLVLCGHCLAQPGDVLVAVVVGTLSPARCSGEHS